MPILENWPIVTLTSDFGRSDYHLARLKGQLLSAHSQLRIFDISHEIDDYDIVQAAFVFRNAWSAFPIGSIHIVSVNDYYAPDSVFVAFAYRDHYFIGPDNGVFSLVFDQVPAVAYRLPEPTAESLGDSSFRLAEIYAMACAHLAKANPIAEIGKKQKGLTQRITFQPVIGPDYIRASVVHIDRYENAVVNVSQDLFERVGKGRDFALFFKRHDPIEKLSNNYHDVAIGEPLCRFGSAGLLEISINTDKAASLLGLKVKDHVQIDFKGPERKKAKT